MQKREKILAVITVLSGVFFIVNQFLCTAKPAKPQKPAAVKSVPPKRPVIRGEVISNEELEKRLQNWQPLVTYETWGSNPFIGGMKLTPDSLADSSALVLKGIAWKGRKAFALIGDWILQVGERRGDFEVVQIHEDRVLIRKNGELVTLQLHAEQNESMPNHDQNPSVY